MNFSLAELVSIPPRLRALLLAAVLFLFAALVAVAGYLAVSGANERMLLTALSAAQFVGTGAAALAILLLSSRSLRPSALRRETTHFLTVQVPHALERCDSGVPHDLTKWSSRRDDTDTFYGELHVDHERETPTGTYLVRYQDTYLLFRVVMNAKKLLVMYFLKTESGLDHLRDQVLGVTIRGATHAGWEFHVAQNPDSISGETLQEFYFFKTVGDDFLFNNVERLYWSLDIAQMTRSFVLQLARNKVVNDYKRIVALD